MEYRLHCLDEQRCIVSIHQIAAPDDLAALDRAERLCGEYSIEVWQGALCVARVKKGNAALDASDRMSL